MSWLSQNIGSAMGALNFSDPLLGAVSGMAYDQSRNNGSDPQISALGLNQANSERANSIIQDIQANNTGSYGEDQVKAAVKNLNVLKGELQSGKLSQSDYLQITGSFLPQIQEWANKADQTGGSAISKAMQYVGLKDLNSHFADYNIYQSGQQMLGRDLTPEEVAQAKPIFNQANGVELGNAWLAQLKQVDMQNPNSSTNQKKAAGMGDQVNQYFKSTLGRDATDDEKSHFGSLMATGNLDAYGMQQFLQGSSEYQGQQNKKFQSELGDQLQQTDLNFFNRAKQGVMSQFMQNGTGQSSALDSALTDLMGQIADKRSEYMANLSANQYGSNQGLAVGNYQNQMSQYLNDQQYNRGQAQKNMDYYTGRSNELTDYQTQKNDWMNYANSQQGGGNPLSGAINGGLQGAMAGGMAGGPYGALAGGVLGAGGGYYANK